MFKVSILSLFLYLFFLQSCSHSSPKNENLNSNNISDCESAVIENGFRHIASQQCINLFKNTENRTSKKPEYIKSLRHKITNDEMQVFLKQSISKVEEFRYINELSKELGVRAWLFGGTASSFLHYAKWDLARIKGVADLQKDRFNYDFTEIFRSTQDVDIVIDGNPDQVREFQEKISHRFKYFLGAKDTWEVRSLNYQLGDPKTGYFKEALLNDLNFANQNTDTNSLAMIELTESNEPVVRDLNN